MYTLQEKVSLLVSLTPRALFSFFKKNIVVVGVGKQVSFVI
jgi:hypothetical protein